MNSGVTITALCIGGWWGLGIEGGYLIIKCAYKHPEYWEQTSIHPRF